MGIVVVERCLCMSLPKQLVTLFARPAKPEARSKLVGARNYMRISPHNSTST